MTERKQLRGTDVKRLNRTWRRSTKGRVGLIVESVTQPFNIGSIARSAAVFGVEQLWLSGNATPLTHPNVGKTALGTERLEPAQVEQTLGVLLKYQEDVATMRGGGARTILEETSPYGSRTSSSRK